jgi:probable F420-dependent oxidoreductase
MTASRTKLCWRVVGRRRPTREAGERMRVGVHLPQYGRVAGPDAIQQAARHAEDLGFLDLWVSDHVVHPVAQDYPSPYLFDPLITLTWAAAVTEHIGLGTSVLVVPMHNPLELANALASLDHLSGGRLTVAVGVGWSAQEYGALGSDFHNRGDRLDEAIDLFRRAWVEDTFHGRFSSFDDIRLLPKPSRPIPIWIGGGSEPAYRRAAERGDGYQAVGLTPEAAVPMVERIRRDHAELNFPISLRTGWDPQGMDPGRIKDECAAFSEAGVQHVVAAPWQRDLENWLRSMDKLAELVL